MSEQQYNSFGENSQTVIKFKFNTLKSFYNVLFDKKLIIVNK